MDNNISFSKIVATPTLNSWSQAYNAGKLFAVLSLEKTQETQQDSESLNMLGKDLLERLEQEFFTIENKDLESIKKAVVNTFRNQKESIGLSFTIAAFINNVLYLFSQGYGKVFIKRGGNFGMILDSGDANSITASSGFLKDNDLIAISTKAFSETITNDELNSSLDESLPSEIAESLAPKIHKAEDGKIAAIIIKHGNPQMSEEAVETDEPLPHQDFQEQAKLIEETSREEAINEKPISRFIKYIFLLKSKLKIPNVKIKSTKKPVLIAIVVITTALIFSISTAIQAQNNAKIRALFAQIYPQAQKKYDEGQSLLDLNKNLSRDAFVSAQKILNENKNKFPAKSRELIQAQDLLQKIANGLTQASPVDSSGLDRSKLSITVANGSGIEGAGGKAAAIFKGFGYSIASIENADNFNYKGATIKVKKDKSNFLNLLKKDLAKEYAITSASSDYSPNSPTDCLIIIGK